MSGGDIFWVMVVVVSDILLGSGTVIYGVGLGVGVGVGVGSGEGSGVGFCMVSSGLVSSGSALYVVANT